MQSSEAHEQLTKTLTTTSAATVTYGGVLEGLKIRALQLVQTIKSLVTALMGNPYAMAAVGVAALGTAMYALIKHQERVREEISAAADEAVSRIDEIKSATTEMADVVKNASSSFAELSKGVDMLTGENLYLDNEDYQEFLSISNQIADLFPTLPRVYDANGNAIVNLGTDAESVAASLNELYEQQKRINDLEIVDELPAIFKEAQASSREYALSILDLEKEYEALKKEQEYYTGGGFQKDVDEILGRFHGLPDNEAELGFSINIMDEAEYKKELDRITKTLKSLDVDFDYEELPSIDESFVATFTISDDELDTAMEHNADAVQAVINDVTAQTNKAYEALEVERRKQEATWNQFAANLSSVLNVELQSYAMEDQAQNAVRSMVGNINWQELVDEGIISTGEKGFDQAMDYIRDHAIRLVNAMPQEISAALQNKLDFESGKIDYDEYKETAQQFLDIFAEGFDEADYNDLEDILSSKLAEAYEDIFEKAPDEASYDKLLAFMEENAIDTAGEIEKLSVALGDGTLSAEEMQAALSAYANDNAIDLLSSKVQTLTDRFATYKEVLDTVETAQDELSKSGVLTEETAAILQGEFGNLDKILKLTTRGWELNTEAIDHYNEQQQAVVQGNILSQLSALKDRLIDVDREMANLSGDETMMTALRNERDDIEAEIRSLLNLQAEINNLSSTYNQFINSFSEEDDWANYDTIVGKLEEVKDLANNGDWADNSIRTFIEYISGIDASDLMGDDLRNAYADAMAQAEKYFTTGTEGIRHFVAAAEEAGYVIDGEFKLDNIPKMAEDLGMTTDALTDILNAVQRTGDVKIEFSNWFPGANDINTILDNYKTLAALVQTIEASGGVVDQETQSALDFYQEQLYSLKELQDQIKSFDAAGPTGQTEEWAQRIQESLDYYGVSKEQMLEVNVNVNSEELQNQVAQFAEENDTYVQVGMDPDSTLSKDIDDVVSEIRTIPITLSSTSVAKVRSELDTLFKPRNVSIGNINSSLSANRNTSIFRIPQSRWRGSAAFNSGKITAGYRGPALVGELGKELLVRNGVAIPVGVGGAEMINVQKDDIIFNHRQTAELEKNGRINSRGKAFAEGTGAFANGIQSGRQSGNAGNIPVSNVDIERAEKAAEEAAKAAKKASEASKSVKADSEETYDYFERMIEVLENGVDYIDSVLENINGSMAKNPLIDKQMSYVKAEIAGYTEAIGMYQGLADQALAKLPGEIQEKIRAGAVEVAKYMSEGDESILTAIDEYTQWDDKVQDCRKSIEEQTTALRKMAKLKFDNIIDDFEKLNDIYSGSNDLLDGQIGLLEEAGLEVGEEFYRAQATNSERLLATLEQQRSAAVKAFEQALTSGDIRKGDEQYTEMLSTLMDIDSAILDAKTDVEKFNNAVLQLKWDRFDSLQEQFQNIDDELSNLYELFSAETDIKVSDRHGTWTEEALAQLGLLSQQYEVNKLQAEQYAEAQRDLEQMYRAGQYTTTEYIEKLAELKNGQWDAIDAYRAAEDAIMQLNEARVEEECEAIQEEIDAFKELTDAQIEALEAAEDLHDYQVSISEKTKDIADIQRQLAAMQNDDTAATVAKRKRLEEELAEAQKDLAEFERDHRVEEQTNALNDQYEEYEKRREEEMEALRKTLEDRENIILQSMNQVKDNATVIGDQIDLMAKEHGLNISDTIVDSWNSGSNAIAGYNDQLTASTSNFISQLNEVEEAAKRLQDRADQVSMSLSHMFTHNAQSIVNEIQAGYDSIKDVDTSADVWVDKNVPSGSSSGGSGSTTIVGNIKDSFQDAVTEAVDQLGKYTFSRPEPGLVEAYDGSGNLVGTYTLDEAKKLFGSMLKFAKGGIVEDTKSPLNQIAKSLGEDTLVAAKVGEGILTPGQTKAMLALAPILEQFKSSFEDLRRNDSGNAPSSSSRPSMTINVEKMVNVEGNVDDNNVDKIAKVAKSEINKFMTKWNRDLKYNGY